MRPAGRRRTSTQPEPPEKLLLQKRSCEITACLSGSGWCDPGSR
jgi:hypothetical protein